MLVTLIQTPTWGRPFHPSKLTPRALVCFFTLSVTLAVCLTDAVHGQDAGTPHKQFENSLGMKFTLIPGGEFNMGSDESVASRQGDYPQYEAARLDLADERPAHKVRITKAFYFGTFEVTRGDFGKFVEQSGRLSDAESDGTGGYGHERGRGLDGDAFAGRDPKYNWKNTGFPQEDGHPVVNVTWDDAVAMAQWLSKKEGRRYRLPTEAEWEYACRAGTTTRYYNGDSPKNLLQVAVAYDADTLEEFPQWTPFALQGHDKYRFTAPVGSKLPNAFGLFDMHGNAWEWCSDFYSEDYYAKSPVDDPQGPTEGARRVRRGGSWHSWSFYTRSTFRNYNTQASRYPLLGFRLVLETSAQ